MHAHLTVSTDLGGSREGWRKQKIAQQMFPDKCFFLFFFKAQVANAEVYFRACRCQQMFEKTCTCLDNYTQKLTAGLHKESVFQKRIIQQDFIYRFSMFILEWFFRTDFNPIFILEPLYFQKWGHTKRGTRNRRCLQTLPREYNQRTQCLETLTLRHWSSH